MPRWCSRKTAPATRTASTRSNYGLTKVPQVKSYRGFIFGSLNADVLPLEQHLGPAAACIDLLADQSPQGLEILKGSSTYTFRGNWKIQAENGVDGYHLYATHGNYVMTTEHRRKLRGDADPIKAMQVGGIDKKQGGFFDLGHGHVMLWGDFPNPADRPNFSQLAAYTEKFGAQKAHWMVARLRNLLLYPNVFVMDQTSTQIRVFRPISVDETEVTIYGIAPKGEKRQGPRAPHPPVGGLLQRLGHGDAGRHHGIHAKPDRLQGQGGALERRLARPQARALQRTERGSRLAGHPGEVLRHQAGGRGNHGRPAPLVAGNPDPRPARLTAATRQDTIMKQDITQACADLLYTEARRLDQRDWDGWLDLYLPQATFWIPMWDTEYELTTDPQSQLSLMWYGDRSGLEDRVFRIRTGMSSASVPLPRTVHQITNILAEPQGDGDIMVYSNCQTMSYRHKTIDNFYCHYEHRLRPVAGTLKIIAKKIIVANDLIRDVMDFYRV